MARWQRRLLSTPLAGYLGTCHAVMNHDTTARLSRISVPTLVMAASDDLGTPAAQMQSVAGAIAGAQWALIDGAAHMSALEKPADFEAAVRAFLQGL